jgi:hypothetical protein
VWKFPIFPQASLKKNIIWRRKILEIRRKRIRKNAAVDPEPGMMALHCHCQFTGVYNQGFVLSLDTPPSVYMYICPEAEFLDVIGQKSSEFFSLLFTVTSTSDFIPLHHLSKTGLKLVWNVNIIYRNLKSENSQDYAQIP